MTMCRVGRNFIIIIDKKSRFSATSGRTSHRTLSSPSDVETGDGLLARWDK